MQSGTQQPSGRLGRCIPDRGLPLLWLLSPVTPKGEPTQELPDWHWFTSPGEHQTREPESYVRPISESEFLLPQEGLSNESPSTASTPCNSAGARRAARLRHSDEPGPLLPGDIPFDPAATLVRSAKTTGRVLDKLAAISTRLRIERRRGARLPK